MADTEVKPVETKPQEAPVAKPWEQEWVQKPVQAISESIQETKATVTEAVKGFKWPWERDWTSKTPEPTQTADKAVKQPSTEIDVEKHVDKVIAAESSNRPNAKSKTSTAAGLAQFTIGTWREQVAKQGKDYVAKDRFDPVKAREIAVGFTKENLERARKQLSREPTAAELYMYHMLPQGASRLIKANDNTPAAELYSAAITKANKEIFFEKDGRKLVPRTVGEVKAIFERKVR